MTLKKTQKKTYEVIVSVQMTAFLHVTDSVCPLGRHGSHVEGAKQSTGRGLSRIYRLGEKSRVAEGHEAPRGVRGHAPPEIF